MNKSFIRLKLKMLLLVALGVLAAGCVGLLALDFLIDGVLQDPFADLFVWIARHWFGQTLEEALHDYETCVQGNKPYLLAGVHAGDMPLV